jgi:hypothetical protein
METLTLVNSGSAAETAYTRMMMPSAVKPTITIHDEDTMTLRIHGISYSFEWKWDNDEGDDGEWFNTYMSMPQPADSLVWIEFYPWFHYHSGVGVEATHTLYIYNGNNAAEVHIHDCVVEDPYDILGWKQGQLLKKVAMDDD